MSTSVVESVDGTSGTLGLAPSVTIATTPSAGDILIVVVQHTSSIGTTSISGCGATWTTLQATQTTGVLDHHIFIGTGATSAGTISITAGTSRTGLVRALVVRGANSTTVIATTVEHNINGGASTTGDTVTASPSQAVLCIMGSTGGSNTLFSATTPGSGWSLDTANGTNVLQTGIRNAASSSESHNCSGSCSSGTAHQFTFTMLTVGAAGGASVSGTAAAPLGALTGSATGLRTRIGTAAAVLGTLAASGTGVRTHTTTAAAPLGSVTSSATSVRTHPATATATLGALASTATGLRTAFGTAAAPFGSLTSAAISVTPVNGTATAPLGALASTGAGVRTRPGTATAPLGSVTSTALSVRSAIGSGSAGLGVLVAAATGRTTRAGTASAPLGGLSGVAAHPATPGTAAALLGRLTARGFQVREGKVHRVGDGVMSLPYDDPADNTGVLPKLINGTFDRAPTPGNLLTFTVVEQVRAAPGVHTGTVGEWWLSPVADFVTADFVHAVSVYTFYKFAEPGEQVPVFEVGSTAFGVMHEWAGVQDAHGFIGPADSTMGEAGARTASGNLTSAAITTSNPDWIFAPVGGHVDTPPAVISWNSPTRPAGGYYEHNGGFLAFGGQDALTPGAGHYVGLNYSIPGSIPLISMGPLSFIIAPVSATAPLGGLTGTAGGRGSHRGTASAALGALVAGQPARGIARADLGGITAAARAAVRATATAPLGGLSSETVGRIATFAPGGGILTVTPGSSTFGATGRIVLGAVGVDTDGTIVSGVALNATSSWPSLALFDLLGRTKLGNLHPRGLTWRDPLDGAGVLKFDLPMDEVISGQAGGKRIVKAFMNGKARIAARIDAHTTELAVDDTVWRSFELAGALEMWNDGITLPEYGLKRASSQTRTFGPMSQADNWASRTPFVAASGFPLSEDTGRKKGKPAGLKSLNPWWIALTDPYDSQPPNEQQWFVKRFTNYAAFTWQMLAAADDYMSIWVDGEQVFSPDQANQQSWKYLAQIDGSFEPGPHVIAVEVVNSTFDNSHNPVALIMAIQRTNASGDPVKGAPFLITNDRWLVTDEISEWHHAEVLLTLVEEMTSAGVLAFQILRAGFSDTTDSDGEAFTDGGRPTVQIGQGVADVGLTFAETYFDLSVDATTMRVLVHKRLGTDRFATVRLKLGDVDDGGLIKHTIARREARQNSAIMQLADGTWTTREDAASVDAYGRAMIALSLGSTAATDSADAVADSQFNETAHPTRSITSETHALVGPQPYRHYFKGDSIGVVNEDEDGYVKTRVVAINVDASGDDVVRAWPEVEEDRT